MKRIKPIVVFFAKNFYNTLLLLITLNIVLMCAYAIYKPMFGGDKQYNEKKIALSKSITHNKIQWAEQYFKDELKVKGEYIPFVGFKEKKYTSSTINIDNSGYRLSRNQSENPDIVFLGGSTMFGYGSHDQSTIPSYVAKYLKDSFSVRNMGNSAHFSYQSLIKLQSHLILHKNPKYVVSYEGVNETMLLKGYGKKQLIHDYSDLFSEIIKGKSNFNTTNEGLGFKSYFFSQLTPLMTFTRMFLVKFGFIETKGLNSLYKSWETEIDFAARSLLDSWKSMLAISKSEKFELICILQPVVNIGNPQTDHLQTDKIYEEIYPALYEKILDKMANDSSYYDLRDHFYDFSNKLDGEVPYFYDICHINPAGNAIIAQSIIELINK